METTKLHAQLRDDTSKSHLKAMRRQGKLPGSLYSKGQDTLSLEIRVADFARALKTDAGMHAIMDIDIEGYEGGLSNTAVIKSVQQHPITGFVLQVDFERVAMSDIITTSLPVVLIGDAPGLLNGGVLEQVMNELEIRSRADQIPLNVEIDVSGMEIGDVVRASDITLPDGVELETRPEDVVITMHPPSVRAAEEELVIGTEAVSTETTK